mgnify:CR=1 FL=1
MSEARSQKSSLSIVRSKKTIVQLNTHFFLLLTSYFLLLASCFWLLSGEAAESHQAQDWLPGLDALAMGAVIAILAPMGDLFESMLKRDLGLKDFGSILSMHRDARGAVLAALREIYDGSWSRSIGVDGGRRCAALRDGH